MWPVQSVWSWTGRSIGLIVNPVVDALAGLVLKTSVSLPSLPYLTNVHIPPKALPKAHLEHSFVILWKLNLSLLIYMPKGLAGLVNIRSLRRGLAGILGDWRKRKSKLRNKKEKVFDKNKIGNKKEQVFDVSSFLFFFSLNISSGFFFFCSLVMKWGRSRLLSISFRPNNPSVCLYLNKKIKNHLIMFLFIYWWIE